jgi:hypothetical protein
MSDTQDMAARLAAVLHAWRDDARAQRLHLDWQLENGRKGDLALARMHDWVEGLLATAYGASELAEELIGEITEEEGENDDDVEANVESAEELRRRGPDACAPGLSF